MAVRQAQDETHRQLKTQQVKNLKQTHKTYPANSAEIKSQSFSIEHPTQLIHRASIAATHECDCCSAIYYYYCYDYYHYCKCRSFV